MSTEPATDEIKKIWRDQPTEDRPMSLEEIRWTADKFYRRIRNRNRREYIAAAIILPVSCVYAWHAPNWIGRLGAVIEIVGILFVVWQQHKRGSVRTSPQNGSATDLIGFYLAELTRQRDALQAVWRWYLAPIVPGAALVMVSRYVGTPARGRTIEWDHQIVISSAVIVALIFIIVWLVNLLGASRLQRKIDELDRIRSENGSPDQPAV